MSGIALTRLCFSRILIKDLKDKGVLDYAISAAEHDDTFKQGKV